MSVYEVNEEEHRASSTYKSKKLRRKKLTQACSEEFARADSQWLVSFSQSSFTAKNPTYRIAT